MSQEYWNQVYASFTTVNSKDSEWLDRYAEVLSEFVSKPIIDLGCGLGADSLYLLDKGYPVISCDFSGEALEKLINHDPRIVTKQFNLLDGLPFSNNEAYVIIASLSLHYFRWDDTVTIVEEIKRVLDDGGYLICRLNSLHDINYGAGQGVEVEKNFYEKEGRYKRFFDKPSIERMFQGWEIGVMQETDVLRYRHKKQAWEVLVRKY